MISHSRRHRRVPLLLSSYFHQLPQRPMGMVELVTHHRNLAHRIMQMRAARKAQCLAPFPAVAIRTYRRLWTGSITNPERF